MADESDKGTDFDTAAAAETPVETKNQSTLRTKKIDPETLETDAAAELAVGLSGIVGQKKKGRKAKATDGAGVAKRIPVKRATTEVTKRTVPTSVGEEMADLLQLEEENQKLRKLLAEKLRVENANLRKKLQLD